ncbi:hypothetical protein [Streptomyces sp. NPDC056549]|uniref:hypothetical protein n=1 Tax=Streptomyces sp. NPDC056549 TaxID=3345864 RepID=UPI00369C0E3E
MTTAVVYACVECKADSTLVQERAIDEGHDFAERHDLTVVDTITDPYGDPNPQAREGWQRVRDLAADGKVNKVIVRWPNSISPVHEARYGEIAYLQEHGVRVLFSCAPLAAMARAGSP